MTTKLDIEKLLNDALPWDFILTVGGGTEAGGKDFATRPLLIVDELAIASAAQAEDSTKLRSTVASLLNVEPAELAGWGLRHMLAAVASIRAYAESSVQKNFRALARAASEARAETKA